MRLAAGLAMAAMTFAMAAAPAGAWELLGSRDVGQMTDHDQISLPGNRMFNHIRLCVERRPIWFKHLAIHYRNGGTQDVGVAPRLPAGGCTRAIDLNGRERNIDRIDMVYETIAPRHRWDATVKVWGE